VRPTLRRCRAAVVQAAAAILGVESYHAGIVRTLLWVAQNQETPGPDGELGAAPFNTNITNIVEAISNLRDSVDGSDDDDQGIYFAGTGEPNLVPTRLNGLTYARNITSVLDIVYLGGVSPCCLSR
jgi:hypothetical protein